MTKSTITKRLFLAFAICLFFPLIQNSNVFADGEPEWTLVSIEENGVELVPEIIPGEYEWSTPTNVYHVSRTQSTLTVKAILNNLEENKTYHFNYNDNFTSADNGQTVSFNITPSCYSGTCNRNLYLYTNDNYNSYGHKELKFIPQTIGTDNLYVVKATQNNTDLTISNGTIKSDNYTDPITVVYALDSYNSDYTYETSDGKINPNGTISKTHTPNHFSRISSLGSISVSVRNGNNPIPNDYYYLYPDFEITDPNFIPFSGLYVDSVKQNNAELEFSRDNDWSPFVATVNDLQPLTFAFHVDSAMDNLEYALNINYASTYKKFTWLGSELKSGVTVTLPAPLKTIGTNYPTLSISMVHENYSSGLSYSYNGQTAQLQFNSIEDPTIGRFDEVSLKYTKHPDLEISDGVVSPLYHNADEPLAIAINGKYYDSETSYPVKIRILRAIRGAMDDEGEQVFLLETAKTGAELNSGITITLDNFVMDFMDLDNMLLDQSGYLVYIDINRAERYKAYDYTYGAIKALIFHSNGEQNAIAGGAGAISARSRWETTTMSSSAFANNNSVYISYVAENIDTEKTFDYDILYCRGEMMGSTPTNCEEISNGEVSGARLAAGAFSHEITNPKNYPLPTYVFRLKQNNKVINEVTEAFDLFDGAGMLSAKVSTSQNLYYQNYLSSYVVPRGNEVKIANTGINFDNDKNYTVNVSLNGSKVIPCEYVYFENSICTTSVDLSDLNSEATISGKDLNDGKLNVSVTYDEIFNDLYNIYVSINVTDETGAYYPGASIGIKYTTLEEIYKTDQSYIMNTIENFIRNISKNTTIENFSNNFTQDKNGSIKVYDKTGSTEQNGTVGTGMIIRAIDEFGQPIMDTEAVVTGDNSGDGAIDALDLAKERQHLAGIRELEGVYKEAGKVTNSDDITPLDLTRIRQDIAGIREIK